LPIFLTATHSKRLVSTAYRSISNAAHTIKSSCSARTGSIGTQQTILHPNGLDAYPIDVGTQSGIHIYDIAPAGSTTPPAGTLTLRTGDPSVPGGTGPTTVGTIDPTGRYFYTIDEKLGVLNGFTTSQTDGTLTAIGGVTNYGAALVNTPTCLMIDRTGKFMHVINNTSPAGSISAFSITSSTGALAPIGSPTPVGNFPFYATIDSANPQAQILVVPAGDNTSLHLPSVRQLERWR
jgi:6-phosphogluconolactonase (cycloisomerase 2 family)